MRHFVNEGSEKNDLMRLVNPTLSIDEYRSKMGEDKDIIVLALVVMGEGPAGDLVSFVEKSYDFVLDADVSSGEKSDGNYLVFIEMKRDPDAIMHIMNMFDDLMNLTNQSLKDWTFTYYKDTERHPLTKEKLKSTVLLSPTEYDKKLNKNVEESRQLNSLRALSGVKVAPQKTTDPYILDMQIAAGIR